ncbi:uncharacterized protein LOC123376981 isoform X2 [Mauremys mutica]|nr:uncharacterized protein LOC123376981 isoform X2 [Mauremys mutica]XP_044885249.1 uncharacterized protein LOC123376981 isoform X2 [Mauremys mutica]XP_044885250.1 uncharacterized protein LOC123376981 isoform X2 [Mauremys mutica]
MASMEGFAAVFYSEPSVLGLLSNVISAFLVCLQNFSFAHTNIRPEGVENILAGVHLILIGGLSQLLAGFLAFRKYDHLGGTAFLAFAALWSSYGATRVISGAYPPLNNTTLASENATFLLHTDAAQLSTSESAVAGLVAYIFISFILSFCSATVNYIMPFVFGAITLTLVFEGVGLFGQWALVVSGVLELVIVVCGLYGAVALLFKGITQRYVLPGFGNPLFNVLLLGSANSGSSKTTGEEKKKNTKYAEPMALNHLCDTISPFIFAFYTFGYMKTFYVGAIWVSIISICQLFSSFYSYLRDDVYYTTKFGVHSLYWLVMSWEEFTLTVFISIDNVQQSRMGMIGDWFFLATACMLFLMAFNKDVLEVLQNAAFILLTISTIHQIPIRGAYVFFGVSCSLYTAISLYATFASLINSIGEKALIPVGAQVMSSSTLQSVLMSVKSYLMRSKNIPGATICEVPDALFYICNGLAAVSAIQGTLNDPIRQHLSIPSVLIPGAIFQLYVCRIQVQRGRRFGSVLPFCYAAIWATWTWLRFAGHLLNIDAASDGGFTAGSIAFLVVNIFLMVIASYSNLVLLCLTFVMEVLIICFLLFTVEHLPVPLEIVMLSVFGAICIYGATSSLANCIFGKDLIMMGPPLFRVEMTKEDTKDPPPCFCPSSHRTSSLRSIANLLNEGAVCGVPTDTVYALAASCKQPEAIEKIYRIKDRPQEKPICIFISNLDQLRAAAPPFSPLLWEFMENVYPGGIGCIIKKGEWLKKLGVGAGYDRVGTKDSIMIRVPDQTVTVHLIDMTGPLAITSANPSGETDSTHHDMVISRLGHKLEGVLCDGESNEVVASTVVNCTKIDEGGITILREGCVPTAKVRQIFERVKNGDA